MTDEQRITMAKKLFGYEAYFWDLRNMVAALKSDEPAYRKGLAELGVHSEKILRLCKAYADTFARGVLSVGLADLQSLCDWIAEQGREAEKRTPLPATQKELADYLARLTQTAFARTDGEESYQGYAVAPKVRRVYCAAYAQWDSWRKRRKAAPAS